MEHPNITLKIEIEDKSTSDIELVDSINNNELIDSYSKLYSTNIHKYSMPKIININLLSKRFNY